MIGACEIAVGKVQGEKFCVDTVCDAGAYKNFLAKYQTTFNVSVAAVAHVRPQTNANIPITP